MILLLKMIFLTNSFWGRYYNCNLFNILQSAEVSTPASKETHPPRAMVDKSWWLQCKERFAGEYVGCLVWWWGPWGWLFTSIAWILQSKMCFCKGYRYTGKVKIDVEWCCNFASLIKERSGFSQYWCWCCKWSVQQGTSMGEISWAHLDGIGLGCCRFWGTAEKSEKFPDWTQRLWVKGVWRCKCQFNFPEIRLVGLPERSLHQEAYRSKSYVGVHDCWWIAQQKAICYTSSLHAVPIPHRLKTEGAGTSVGGSYEEFRNDSCWHVLSQPLQVNCLSYKFKDPGSL